MTRSITAAILVFSVPLALALTSPSSAGGTPYKLETVATGLDHPWGLAFLPDGAMLVTERSGGLIHIQDGQKTAIVGVPKVHAVSQGGLLDVAIDPDYRATPWIYLSFSALNGDRPTTHVARGKLIGGKLVDVALIFKSNGKGVRSKHFGSRLGFDSDGRLYITHGELGKRENAQDPGNHAGAILRINRDGSVPADNPFIGKPGHMPELFTIGNRNPQGLAVHPKTGQIWTHEHGPQGGDEINIIEAGKNYGWPTITYGVSYGTGFKIGKGSERKGLAQPVYYWDPSIAPSGMAFYTGDKFPGWTGDLFVGALKYQLLVRLELDGDRIVAEERIVDGDIGRIRDVRTGPDGYIYLLNDQADGGVYRLVPKD